MHFSLHPGSGNNPPWHGAWFSTPKLRMKATPEWPWKESNKHCKTELGRVINRGRVLFFVWVGSPCEEVKPLTTCKFYYSVHKKTYHDRICCPLRDLLILSILCFNSVITQFASTHFYFSILDVYFLLQGTNCHEQSETK